MALLKKSYNEEKTVRTEIRSVEQTCVSKTHQIIKSTDVDIPNGLQFVDESGDLLAGVWEVEGVRYAMILAFETTLAQVRESNTTNYQQSARSEISKIDVLEADPEEQKQVILAKLADRLLENEACVTIQEAEKLTWNSAEEVTA